MYHKEHICSTERYARRLKQTLQSEIYFCLDPFGYQLKSFSR